MPHIFRQTSMSLAVGLLLMSLSPSHPLFAQDAAASQPTRVSTSRPVDSSRLTEIESLLREAGKLQDRQQLEDACEVYEEAEDLCRQTFTGDHAVWALQLNGHGLALKRRDLAGHALSKFEAAAAMFARLFPGDHWSVAMSLNNVAGSLRDLDRAAEALPKYEKAAAMYARLHSDDHGDVATSLYNVAVCLEVLSRPAEALPKYEAAAAMYARLHLGDHSEVAMGLNDVAACLEVLGQPAEALPKYEAAAAMLARLLPGDKPEVASSLNNVAACLRSLGRPAEALPKFEAAAAMLARLLLGDKPEVASSMDNVALCLLDLGRAAEALPKFEAAAAMRARLFPGDHSAVAVSLNNVAACLHALGRAAAALPKYEAAAAMKARLLPGDHPAMASSLSNTAACLHALGRVAEALAKFEAAAAMSTRLYPGDHPDLAMGLNNVAFGLQALGRPAEALVKFEAAAAMKARLLPYDHPSVALSLNNVAFCLQSLGRAEAALPKYEAAAAMRARLFHGDHPAVAESLNNVAFCLLDLGRAAEALPKYEAAAAMRARLFPGDHPDLALSLSSLASCLVDLGRAAEALPKFEAAAAMADALGDASSFRWSHNLAQLLLSTGQPERAAALSATAVEQVESLRSQSRGLTEGDRAAFFAELRSFEVYDALVEARVRLGQAPAALEALERGRGRSSLDLLCRSRLDPQSEARRRLEERQDRQGVAEIDAIVRAIGAAETELVRLGHLESTTLARRDLDSEARRAEVARLQADATAARHALMQALRDRARVIADLVPLGRPAAIAEMRTLISGDDGLLAYSLGEGASRVFYLRPDGSVQVHELRRPDGASITREGVRGAVSKVRAMWIAAGRQAAARGIDDESAPAASRPSDAQAASHDLFRMLIPEALWLDLRRAERLELMPDGALNDLPFEALVIEAGKSGAESKYWIDVGPAIVYSSSASVRLMCRAARDAQRAVRQDFAVVAIGDPVFERKEGSEGTPESRPAPESDALALARVERGGMVARHGDLAALPGTRREVASISAAIAGMHDPFAGTLKVLALLGDDATETRIFAEAPRARILHFATHHLADETEDAGFSALALTAPSVPTREDDGYLRLHDLIERWRDRLSGCELVVLSACESAGGPQRKDDGLYAMPLGFLYAGVPSVIASLWSVEDQSTADLMADFYKRLMQRPNAATAPVGTKIPTRLSILTAARKALRAKLPEPYFWAPFIYIGDPR